MEEKEISLCKYCKGSGIIDGLEDTPEEYGLDSEGNCKKVYYSKPCHYCMGIEGKMKDNARSASNIPKSYQGKYLQDVNWNAWKDKDGNSIDFGDNKKLIEHIVEDFEEVYKRGIGLYMHSETKGTGKTFLACVIGNEIISRYSYSVYYVRASDLVAMDKSADSKSSEKYGADPIARLCSCDVLILDDIGTETIDGWLYKILFRVLDDRMNNEKITIMTSNVAREELNFDRIIRRTRDQTLTMRLPEYCVSNAKSNTKKIDLLKKWDMM